MNKLDLYHQKRDFSKTSEPRGTAEVDFIKENSSVSNITEKNLPAFVIQEHHASHLHYDLRLEIDGVLKSWAVPKGVPTSINEKRLAVQTEDHPLAYKDFAGIIPAGEYGAGEVIIWDKGYYTNTHTEKNMLEAWNSGRITVIFNGNKITGKYTLLKTNSGKFTRNAKTTSWLLFKNN